MDEMESWRWTVLDLVTGSQWLLFALLTRVEFISVAKSVNELET